MIFASTFEQISSKHSVILHKLYTEMFLFWNISTGNDFDSTTWHINPLPWQYVSKRCSICGFSLSFMIFFSLLLQFVT